MTAEKMSSDVLDKFIRTAQYISMINSYPIFWKEIKNVFKKYHNVDFFAYLQFDSDVNKPPTVKHTSEQTTSEITKKILKSSQSTISQVVSDGFLSSILISIPESYAVVCCVITESNKNIGVLLIGHKQPEKLSKLQLNIYLAISGLISKTRERLLIIEQLKDYNVKLMEEVKSRTRELFRTNKELELFVKTIPDGILIIQPNGQIRLANQSCQNIAQHILGEPFSTEMNILDVPKDEILLYSLKKVFLKVQNNDVNVNLQIEASNNIWLELSSASPSLSEDSEPIATIIEIKNITPFIELEKMKDQFIASVSHELITPITNISLSLENLQHFGEKFTLIQKEQIFEILIKNLNSLNQLVEDILIAQRIDEHTIILNWNRYFLIQTIDNVILQLTPEINAKGIIYEIDVNENIFLFGEEKRIIQIFRILIDNAVKYSNDNAKIEIKAIDHYDGVLNPHQIDGTLIEIQDHGIGIKEKDWEYLFKRFFRSEDVKNIKGTGLGLSIAKAFVEMHKGEISVKSEYGKGTIFSIFLPRLEEMPNNDMNNHNSKDFENKVKNMYYF